MLHPNVGNILIDDKEAKVVVSKAGPQKGQEEMPKVEIPEILKKSTDYDPLSEVLDRAFRQASEGKGKERHARGNPFAEQHMIRISELLDSPRGMAFQAIKKLTEGLDLESQDAQVRELLGAIVYIAGIVVYLEKQDGKRE